MSALDFFRADRSRPFHPSWDSTLKQVENAFGDFDRFFHARSTEGAGFMGVPPVDIEETATDYRLSIDLPGVKKEEISVEVTGNQLVVTGERKREDKIEDASMFRQERRFGKFVRSFVLPDGVNVDKILAKMDQGVLHLYVPKAQTAVPRKIQVDAI